MIDKCVHSRNVKNSTLFFVFYFFVFRTYSHLAAGGKAKEKNSDLYICVVYLMMI